MKILECVRCGSEMRYDKDEEAWFCDECGMFAVDWGDTYMFDESELSFGRIFEAPYDDDDDY